MAAGRQCALTVLAALAAMATSCGSDATDSDAYRQLAGELAEVTGERDELASQADQLADELAAVTDERDGLDQQLAETLDRRDELADEVRRLRLAYDDEIRADLRTAFDAEVARACEEAARAPGRSIASITRFEADWAVLDLTAKDLDAAVAECAGPARRAAQLTREEAATGLAPAVDLVLDAYRADGDADADLAARDQLVGLVNEVTAGAIYEDPDADWVAALERMGNPRQYCSNSGCTWIWYLTDLAEIDVPGTPMLMRGGDLTVGSGPDEARPGTWIAYNVDDCYWERLDSRGEIIDNNFVSAAPQVQVTIRSSDFAFNSEGCAHWLQFR